MIFRDTHTDTHHNLYIIIIIITFDLSHSFIFDHFLPKTRIECMIDLDIIFLLVYGCMIDNMLEAPSIYYNQFSLSSKLSSKPSLSYREANTLC